MYTYLCMYIFKYIYHVPYMDFRQEAIVVRPTKGADLKISGECSVFLVDLKTPAGAPQPQQQVADR